MLLRDSYDLGTIISAAVTFLIVLFVIRLVLFAVNKKNGTQIQKPDWIETDKFDTPKKKKGK